MNIFYYFSFGLHNVSSLVSFAGKETLRCLALALKIMPMGQQTLSIDDEKDLTFIGLVCFLFIIECLVCFLCMACHNFQHSSCNCCICLIACVLHISLKITDGRRCIRLVSPSPPFHTLFLTYILFAVHPF